MILRRSTLLLLLLLLLPAPIQASAPAQDPAWQEVAPGIDYRKFTLPDPNNVFVARMDRTNLSLTIESTIAQGMLWDGKETVSSMAARYDQALSYWGPGTDPPAWGSRSQVVVAINGSYFDWKTGTPWGGQVQSGWYVQRYGKLEGRSGFGWKLDRTAFIGDCVFHRPDKQRVTYPVTGVTQLINDVNDPRGDDELVLFTPQFNSSTRTPTNGVEVVVEMMRPTLILPDPSYASGIVRQVYNNQGNSLIPFNAVVLSASGTAAAILLENAHAGDEVRISQEISPFQSDCITPDPSVSWTKTYASVQGDFFFLKAGSIQHYENYEANIRNPRTAIAYNQDYIFFIVVDGRDIYNSLGMTIDQLAAFTRVTLGAEWGVAQDGGGSSTMVINGQVMNNTYCNINVCMPRVKAFLPLVARRSRNMQSAPPAAGGVVAAPLVEEREVANGMLMVIALPAELSSTYHPGDLVVTTTDTSLRLGPGTNYATTVQVPTGTPGMILDQLNGLLGINAKGSFWWYVNLGGAVGWIRQGALALR